MMNKLKVILTHSGYDLDTNLNDIGLREWRNPYKQLHFDYGWVVEKASDIGKNANNINEYFSSKYNKLPDFVLFFENHDKYLLVKNKLNCKIGMIINDIHHAKRIAEIRKKIYEKLDIIFATCKNCFGDFYPTIEPSKVIWYPHAAHEDFILPLNENPLNKLILSGALTNIQALRSHVYNLRNKYDIDYLQHPSYRSEDYSNKIVGDRYIKKLNEYLVGFSTEPTKKSKRRYLVNKTVEIPAAGCLLLLGIETELFKKEIEELGFIDGVTYISTTKDELEDKIKYVLNIKNRKEIDRIRRNGYNMVFEKHLVKHRAKLINEIVEDLLD